jgi:hypothetical protein
MSRRALPLAVPVPFRAPSSSLALRADLVEVLGVVDALHELAKPELGTIVGAALADLLPHVEPRADRLVIDLELAIAVGFAVRIFETLGLRKERDDTSVPVSTWNVIAWAAMEQAGGAPDRHVPWIAYGVHAGYYVSRIGRPAITTVRDAFEHWQAGRSPVTHTVTWEGRLVADFGVDGEGRIGAQNYLPLRPAGIERLHDQGCSRPRGTTTPNGEAENAPVAHSASTPSSRFDGSLHSREQQLTCIRSRNGLLGGALTLLRMRHQRCPGARARGRRHRTRQHPRPFERFRRRLRQRS